MNIAYSYVLLRYVHDVATGESLNVGVVVYAPDSQYLGARVATRCQRVKDAFAGLELASLKQVLGYVSSAFAAKARSMKELLNDQGGNHEAGIGAIVRSVLPEDDSSLQWSDRRGGFAEAASLDTVLQRLYERYIGRYESEPSGHGKAEADIWRVCRREFAEAKVEDRLRPNAFYSEIAGDEVSFDYAWKNGIWNCFEPVSFDLKRADGIREKAWRMNGKVGDLREMKNQLRVTYLLAEPRDRKLKGEVEKAEKRLKNSEVPTDIVREDELSDWSREMATRIAEAG